MSYWINADLHRRKVLFVCPSQLVPLPSPTPPATPSPQSTRSTSYPTLNYLIKINLIFLISTLKSLNPWTAKLLTMIAGTIFCSDNNIHNHSVIADFYFYIYFKENWIAVYLYCFWVFVIIFDRSLFCYSVISYKRQYRPTISRTFFVVIPISTILYPASPCSGSKTPAGWKLCSSTAAPSRKLSRSFGTWIATSPRMSSQK